MSDIEKNFKVVWGANKDPEDKRDYLIADTLDKLKGGAGIEDSVDWTSEMTSVKNQGSLGSCLAIAVCSVKEWQERKEHLDTKDKIKEYDLSEQWLYYKCKEIDCWPDSQGTSFRYAMQVLVKNGIPVEQGWNYNAKHKGSPEKWATGVAKWYRCGSYWRIKTLDEFKIALTKGPLAIGILCYDEIFTPDKNGVVPMPKNRKKVRGGHAICAVGFDDSTQLIKFKNSWGTRWGADGYGYISYEYFNKCCLDAWYFADSLVKNNKPANKPVKKEVVVKMEKVKLINKMNQLQIIHILRNGKDENLALPKKGYMVTIKADEVTEDIKMRINGDLLEKK